MVRDAIPQLEVSKVKTIIGIVLEQKTMINTFIKQSEFKACINEKLNDEIISYSFKLPRMTIEPCNT